MSHHKTFPGLGPFQFLTSSEAVMKWKYTKVFFYVPNLIGYGRVLLTLACFFIWKSHPLLFTSFYMVSFFLDGIDGMAARYFNQCSRFGAILDILSDRCSTAALVHILTLLDHSPLLSDPTGFYDGAIAALGLFLNALDIISHWSCMYSSVYSKSESHKKMSPKKNWLMRLYYGNRMFMGMLCVGNEMFYVYFYVLHFYLNAPLWIFVGLFPLWFLKQIVNFVQLGSSLVEIVKLEKIYDKAKKDRTPTK